MLRKGVPPALRCAVWLSNVIQTTHPHENPQHWHAYRTLAKVRALDGAYESVLQRVAELELGSGGETAVSALGGGPTTAAAAAATAWDALPTPSFGRVGGGDNNRAVEALLGAHVPRATSLGRLSLKRVLIAVQRVLRIDRAPVVPTLAALFLTAMSESYAFCALREVLGHRPDWYLAIGRVEGTAHDRAFADVLRRLHPMTASYLDDRGVLDDLSPLFHDLLLGVLPLRYVQRLVDIYTLEGTKCLFRFGVSLLVLYKVESAEQLITISTASDWWDGMRTWAHDARRFDFELVVRKAYGVHGRGLRRQLRFPRRHILQRIVAIEEERLRGEEADADVDGDRDVVVDAEDAAPTQPLGLIRPAVLESHPSTSAHSTFNGGGSGTDRLLHAFPPQQITDGDCIAQPVLAVSPQVRMKLAAWLPLALQSTNLELLYSTAYHGRSLEMLYRRVKDHRHTVLLCEVLDPVPPAVGTSENSVVPQPAAMEVPSSFVVGAYASHVWHVSPRVYGDARCLLFRLSPNPQCWRWSPIRTSSGGIDRMVVEDDFAHDDKDADDNNRTALLEQFMVGTRTYLSMGGTSGGSAGLRLNDDLTKGESSPAAGYGNDPLGGGKAGRVFDVGLVEVYGLVRSLDGRPA